MDAVEKVPYIALPLALIFALVPGFLARFVGVRIIGFNIAVLVIVVALGGSAGVLLSEVRGAVLAFIAMVGAAAVLTSALLATAKFTIAGLRAAAGIPRPMVYGAAAGALTLALKATYGGWLILFEGLFLGVAFATVIFHVALRGFAVETPAGGAKTRLLVVSDGLLLLTALLRWDMGDGPEWLTVTAMVGARGWPLPSLFDFSESGGMIYNGLLHAPVAVAWIATITILMRANGERGARGTQV